MKLNVKTLWIQILSILGLAVSIKLAMIYYSANFDSYALSSFCSINDFIDCDGVARTTLSQVFGIPLAYWGIFLYVIFLFLTLVDKLKNVKILKFLEVFKNPNSYISVLGLISFMCSMVLAGISLFKIHKLCILCVVTYFIDLIIAIIASNCSIKELISNIKTTCIDFIDGVKKYTKTFIVLLLLFVSFLAYSGITLNFVPHIKKHNSIMKYRKITHNPYRINGNVLGNPNGNVVIELYSDYVCPLCYIHNIMLHQIAKEYKNIKIVHHNYPFDKECNPYMQINMHPGACFMSKVAIASREQGDYWGMSSLLYEKQPRNLKEALELAEELNLDKELLKKDMNSEKTLSEITTEIELGNNLNIDATPTMYINGEKYVGVKPYYVLKEIMVKHGAKRK